MKVDEKMIEAGARAICGRELEYQDCETVCVATGKCSGRLSKSVIEDARAAITAMLSAAPTDYGKLVERLRDRTSSGQCFTALLDEAADAIELLSARGSR